MKGSDFFVADTKSVSQTKVEAWYNSTEAKRSR